MGTIISKYFAERINYMASVFGEIGSLTELLAELESKNITSLNSLDEINTFNKDFERRLNKTKEDTKE